VSAILALARPEIVALRAYEHARWDPAFERLHANESPWRDSGDRTNAGLNRYPEPHPDALAARLAAHYGVPAPSVLPGRGSDEGIDLLVRTFCAAGKDRVVTCPPTFGMYAVAARIQGAAVAEVPLRASAGFALDEPAVIAACGAGAKLLFLCAPNNPTGNDLDPAAVRRIAAAVAGRTIVVLDEAYLEFSGRASLAVEAAGAANLVVLRTFSKAHALAGARLGTVIAHPETIGLLRKVIPPYAVTQPTIEAAARALEPAGLAVARERIALLITERERLAAALARSPRVRRVYPSAANFLLVELDDPAAALDATLRAGLLIRDVRGQHALGRCLRVSVGAPEQNDRLIRSLA
jgi:histidinol-phosphate aminotransferase